MRTLRPEAAGSSPRLVGDAERNRRTGPCAKPGLTSSQELFPCGTHLDSPVGFSSPRGRGPSGPRRTPHRHRSAIFRLEHLEDRTMLSTFTVTNLDDSGDGSLRAAIASANDPLLHPGADEIVFAPGLRGTITLTGGELAITDALTIDGPGAGTLAVSGNDVSRVFRVGASVAATIEDLTITRGLTHTPGGGILNQGILTLEDDVVSSNQVVGDLGQTVGGGGIANINGATLTIRDSTFRDNRARGGDGRGLGQAGAISSAGTAAATAVVTVTRSIFTGNQALGGNGGGNGFGGAINQGAYSHLTVTDSTFSGNLARGGNDGVGGSSSTEVLGQGVGGAIRSMGTGAIVSITGSRFNNNQAVGGDNNAGGVGTISQVGLALGGAITQGEGSLTVSDSVFTGNQARGGAQPRQHLLT